MQCYSYRFCKQNFLYGVIREIQPIKIHRACTLQPKSIVFFSRVQEDNKGVWLQDTMHWPHIHVCFTHVRSRSCGNGEASLFKEYQVLYARYTYLYFNIPFISDLTQNCFLMGMNYLVHVQMYFKCQIFLKFSIENESWTYVIVILF